MPAVTFGSSVFGRKACDGLGLSGPAFSDARLEGLGLSGPASSDARLEGLGLSGPASSDARSTKACFRVRRLRTLARDFGFLCLKLIIGTPQLSCPINKY